MCLALAHTLIMKGHEVRVFCLDADAQMPIPGNESVRRELAGSITHFSAMSNSASTLRKCIALPNQVRGLRRAVLDEQLDLIISFMERANVVNLLAVHNQPRIVSIRRHPATGLANPSLPKRLLVRVGYQWLLRFADEVNFNAYASAEAFMQQFPCVRGRVSVIHNFYDKAIKTQALEPLDDSEGREPKRPFVLACGRLVRNKGYFTLLRAFASLASENPDIDLVILGDGPLYRPLTRMVADYGLGHQVHLPGFDRNPYRWMSRSHLFVLPSRSEGFPNALLEAMALRCPVIASDCPSGPRELLAPDSPAGSCGTRLEWARYGLLSPVPKNALPTAEEPLCPAERALAHGIATLLEDAPLRARYADRAGIRAQAFTRDRIVQQWLVRLAS